MALFMAIAAALAWAGMGYDMASRGLDELEYAPVFIGAFGILILGIYNAIVTVYQAKESDDTG